MRGVRRERAGAPGRARRHRGGVDRALVIILFLLHLRSSLLPILSLPISVALSFIPMALLDIPSTIMSLGGIAIAIGATVDAEIVMIEAAHKRLEHAPHASGAERHALLAAAAKEVTPAIFFSLLIIAVAFLPVFTLTGQAGRLFRPLAFTKTFVMLLSALLSITFAPALRDVLIRGNIWPESRHPLSRLIMRIYEPFVYVALRRPKSTLAIGLCALASAGVLAGKLGHEFIPPLWARLRSISRSAGPRTRRSGRIFPFPSPPRSAAGERVRVRGAGGRCLSQGLPSP